jgi:hypothetical protein
MNKIKCPLSIRRFPNGGKRPRELAEVGDKTSGPSSTPRIAMVWPLQVARSRGHYSAVLNIASVLKLINMQDEMLL